MAERAQPYVTISFANRNDNYGGFLSQRIQLFIDYYAHFVNAWPDLFEFVIIDYNPPEDKPRLRDAFDWGALGRVIHCDVSAEVHQAIPGANSRKIQDYIARNVGLRYGTAPFGMVLNQDIFISNSILQFIARRELSPKHFYRADRCDFNLDPCAGQPAPEFERLAQAHTFVVHRRHSTRYHAISEAVQGGNILASGSVPEPGDRLDIQNALIYCDGARKLVEEDKDAYFARVPAEEIMAHAKRRPEGWEAQFRGPEYYGHLNLHTNASGDFVIAAKEAWEKIHGFPEDPGFYMQTDAYGIFQLFAAGYDQVIFMQPHRIYHADHSRADRAGFKEPEYTEHESRFSKIIRGELSYCYNGPDWGLSAYPLQFFNHLAFPSHSSKPAPRKAPDMTMQSTNTNYDVVVIGNGSLGVSVAYQLKKKDKNLRVAVIGPENRHHAASTTAGAMINVWAELTHNQFSYPALLDRITLGINAFGMWDGLCAELSQYVADPVKITWGTYVMNNAYSSDVEEKTLDYILECMKRFSVPHRMCNAGEIPWYKPEVRARATRIVHLPDGRFDPYKVLAAYDKALAAVGVDVFMDEAVALTLGKNGDVHSVTTRNGAKFQGKQVVLANGSFAQSLIDPLPELRSATPRLLWGGGSAIDVQFPDWVMRGGGLDMEIFKMDAVIRTVDRGGACGVHMIPHGNGRYYLGASSGVWINPEWAPRAHAIHVLLRALEEEINTAFFYSTIALRGPGFRPTTIDTFPLLGESHVKGVWFANGTKRDGFTCSAFIAPELAKAMAGEAHQLPKRFQPSRELISYKNRAAALDDAANAAYGGEVQHGLSLPPYALQDYRRSKRAAFERIYEKRGMDNFGIHPEVTHCYEDDGQFALINHPREKVSG